MKFLLVIAVLVVAYLLWRAARTRALRDEHAAAPKPPELAQDMVRCPVCSLHLPRPDAIAGASGRLYCTPEHRRSGGD